MKKVGTRQEVWEGTAEKTVSGLTKEKFMLNKRGKVVSKARSLASQKNIERLKQFQFRKAEKIENDNKNGEHSTPSKRKK